MLITYPIGNQKDGKKMLDVNLDICKFLKTKNRSNIFMIFLLETFQKFGFIPTKCPVPKDHYYVRNLTYNGMNVPFSQYIFKDCDLLSLMSINTKEGKNVKQVIYTEAKFTLKNN